MSLEWMVNEEEYKKFRKEHNDRQREMIKFANKNGRDNKDDNEDVPCYINELKMLYISYKKAIKDLEKDHKECVEQMIALMTNFIILNQKKESLNNKANNIESRIDHLIISNKGNL